MDTDTKAYYPADWAEIGAEWGLFEDVKHANANIDYGTRRFCKQKKKKYSAAALWAGGANGWMPWMRLEPPQPRWTKT